MNMSLRKMPQHHYFENDPDTTFGKSVLLREEGIKLVVQYYREKYDVNIIMNDSLYAQDQGFMEMVKQGRAGEGDFRCAYILRGLRHATPVFYIKSGDREGFFIPDSQGRMHKHNYGQVNSIIDEFLSVHFPDIPIFVTEDIRQSDLISCYTDALVFLRDVTAKKENTYFKSAHLLGQLESRSKEQVVEIISGLSEKKIKVKLKQALLPDELLKTAQISKFVEANKSKAKNPNVIHVRKDGVEENLTQFRERYTATKTDKRQYNGYLRKKGLKYSQIIIQQYYKDQLIHELNKLPGMDKEQVARLANDFVNQLKTQGAKITNNIAFTFAQSVISNIKEGAQEIDINLLLNELSSSEEDESENLTLSQETVFTSTNQTPATFADEDNNGTHSNLTHYVSTLSLAMQQSIHSLSKNFLVSGQNEKRARLNGLYEQFHDQCQNGNWDLAYSSIIDFLKEASTARGGSFNFYKARYGDTLSAKAFLNVLHIAEYGDFVKELQEKAKQDSDVKETDNATVKG